MGSTHDKSSTGAPPGGAGMKLGRTKRNDDAMGSDEAARRASAKAASKAINDAPTASYGRGAEAGAVKDALRQERRSETER
jgi:hypothetical protein